MSQEIFNPHNLFFDQEEKDYQKFLYEMLLEIQKSHSFFNNFCHFENILSTSLRSQKMIIFKRRKKDRTLSTEILNNEERKKIDLSFGLTSIAGFAALRKEVICISNVDDKDELARHHPLLQHHKELDQNINCSIQSTMVIPIIHENILVGVIQAINRIDDVYDFKDIDRGKTLARILAHHFSHELGLLTDPFELLVRNKVIHKKIIDDIKQLSNKSGTSAAHLLMLEQHIEIEKIAESYEKFYQVPFIAYDPNHKLPESIFKKLKPSYLKKNGWLPIMETIDTVKIVCTDPTNSDSIIDVEHIFRGKKVEICVGIPEDFFQYLDTNQSKSNTPSTKNLERLIKDSLNSESDHSTSTIIQLVDEIIYQAYLQRASDIHIQPSESPEQTTIKYRIDGTCQISTLIPHQITEHLISRIKVMASMDISDKRLPQDGKILINNSSLSIELRVATIPNVHGTETVVLRLLAKAKALKLTDLNLSANNYQRVRSLVHKPHGIFLVVGPTGSGKTTTLHSILSEINTPEKTIWTAEDPVEITQSGLQQVQVKSKIGFDFARALRSFLRADPDVIMVGEMRDHETAQIGIEASLTGHLVFSTLHTNSASETIVRLLDMGIDPLNFTDALLGILAQRLVRLLCNDCKQQYPASKDEIEKISILYGKELFAKLNLDVNNFTLMKPIGCSKCNGTGYKGRTGVHELLVNTEAMKNLIYSRCSVNEIKELAYKDGMKTLLQDALEKVLHGETDLTQIKTVIGTDV